VNVRTLPCPICKKSSVLDVDEEQMERYANGELIQRAFPDMPPSERELLITGTHPECWDKMWK
jgi:uncharacterized protein YbaR (Trm112 family)